MKGTLLEPAPRRGRGPSKKTTARDAQEHEAHERGLREDQSEDPSSTAKSRVRGTAMDVDSIATSASTPVHPPRRRPKPSSVSPRDVFEQYCTAVDDRLLGFYQIDSRTWVAELCDLDHIDDELRTFSGVDAWSILRSEVDEHEVVSFTCTPCPDFASLGRCVHTMLLKSDDVPPFKQFSKRGMHAVAARSLLRHAAHRNYR